jgi:peptidoglycan/LPS O-acetylase OafA/YrhL
MTSAAAAITPRPAHRIEGADGLRGLAALFVVVHHMFDACNVPELRVHRINLLRPVNDLWFSVDLFLVLSGFVLFLPYAGNAQRKFDFGDFMLRRVRRIVPAYYASLAIVTVLYVAISAVLRVDVYHNPSGVLDVVLHLLLLHTLYVKTLWSWIGSTWNLGLEWIWYLCFGAAVWLFRRAGAFMAIILMACITFAYLCGVYFWVGSAASMSEVQWMYYDDSVPGRLVEFGLGMFVAWWLANITVRPGSIRAAVFLIPVGLLVAHQRWPIDFGVRSLLYSITFALVLFAAAAPHDNIVRSLLSARWLRWVGECSYSLYLFHLPFVALICTEFQRLTHSNAKAFGLSVLLIPAIVLVARLSYVLFERPFMRAKPARTAAAQPRTVAAS